MDQERKRQMAVLQDPGLCIGRTGCGGRGRDAEGTNTGRDEVRVDENGIE